MGCDNDASADFDIDVDVSGLLGSEDESLLVSDSLYRLAQTTYLKNPTLRAKATRMLDNALLHAQWTARSRKALDRRRAVRAPLVSRVHMDNGRHLVSTDISLSGMRCSGMPQAPVMNIEFTLPNLRFPVATRVEIVTFKQSAVTPLCGLRFINLERTYREYIANYVSERRDRILRAA
jgi:hypothetical protein